MPKHVKPTAEELESAAQAAAAEAERLKKEEEAKVHASPSPSVAAPSSSPSPAAPSPSPSPAAPSPSPSPEPYKKKAIEQGRENIVLHGKIKKTNDAIDQAAALAEPTEEELRVAYPEWDDMTTVEQKLAKENLKNSKKFQIIASARQEERGVEEWNGKVDAFLQDPKTLVTYPELEGKLEDFALFSTKPTRIGVPFDILVSAFLHDATKDMKPKKKEMFPSGSAGPTGKPKPKTDKIGLDEARRLRETNYPEYVKKLREGKIDTSELNEAGS